MPYLIMAVLGALLPTLFYVSLVWWLDRYEKEPVWLLALAFLWGAIPATLLSALLEYIVDMPIYKLGGEGLAAALASASFAAPVVEETAKGLALILLVLFFLRELDDELDGIVYGAMIGFGFAFSENAFAYFLPILQEQGAGVGLLNIFVRSVVFGLNHAIWTAIVGAAVGYARISRSWPQRLLALLGAWLLAVALHGIHNVGATLARRTFYLSLGLSAVVSWAGAMLLLAVVALVLRRESRWIDLGLLGVLPAREHGVLRSSSQRFWIRTRALIWGGPVAYRDVGRYFQCATELAFKRLQYERSSGGAAESAEIQRLYSRLLSFRPRALPWL